MLQLLNNMFETGMYDQLYKSGLVSSKLRNYRDMYLYVDAQIKTRNLKKHAAVKEASAIFQCDERTVYRAISSLSMPLILPK